MCMLFLGTSLEQVLTSDNVKQENKSLTFNFLGGNNRGRSNDPKSKSYPQKQRAEMGMHKVLLIS